MKPLPAGSNFNLQVSTPEVDRKNRKVNVFQFILHDHTFLGLFFARDGQISIGCCCCLCTEPLERRHRLWLFLYIAVATIIVSVQVSLGVSSKFHAFAVTTFVIMPSTCYIKNHLAWASRRLHHIFPCFRRCLVLRCEEYLLLAAAGAAVWSLFRDRGESVTVPALSLAVHSWAAQLVLEVPCMAWKYLGKSICCPCCIPRGRDFLEISDRVVDSVESGESQMIHC